MPLTNREQTTEQFSTGTTVDGNRLDKALRSIVAFWNALPKRNRQRKYVQTQMVGGFMMGATVARTLPFLSVANTAYFYGDAGKQNFWRFKGTRIAGIDPTTADPTLARVICWSPRIAFPKGAILDGIFVAMDRDGYLPAPAAGLTGSDLSVVVEVDDAWTPDEKRTTLSTYLFNRLDLRGFWSLADALGAWVHANTLLPAYAPSAVRAFNAFFGFCLEERGLGIALPEKTRLRLGIVIPKYNAITNGWSVTPWAEGNWSWTLTFLEEVE